MDFERLRELALQANTEAEIATQTIVDFNEKMRTIDYGLPCWPEVLDSLAMGEKCLTIGFDRVMGFWQVVFYLGDSDEEARSVVAQGSREIRIFVARLLPKLLQSMTDHMENWLKIVEITKGGDAL